MTVAQLITALQQFPGEAIVEVYDEYDYDAGDWFPVETIAQVPVWVSKKTGKPIARADTRYGTLQPLPLIRLSA